jgi:hypothetical protein
LSRLIAEADVPTDDSVNEELDLDTFKHTLGSAAPVRFNAEGGLRERWIAPRPKYERALRDSLAEHDGALAVAEEPWEKERKQRRRAAARNATFALIAWGLAAFVWSKTDWQRQIESPSPAQHPVKILIQAAPAFYGTNQSGGHLQYGYQGPKSSETVLVSRSPQSRRLFEP